MQVIQAQSAGFCMGVSLALQRLYNEFSEYQAMPEQERTRLVMWGPIIHNPLVMEKYTDAGVLCIEKLEDIRPGDRVIVRAHGIPIEIERGLASSGATIVDATCPKVKKAQLSIRRQADQGKFLLLYGEEQHPEVQGLVSYARHNAFVSSSAEALQEFHLSNDTEYFLAAQTTQDKEQFQNIAACLQQRQAKAIPLLETICDATKERQNEVFSLAPRVEVMVVVGGFNSGNTRRLASIAQGLGVPTAHVEQVSDLPLELFKNVRVAGLTAGASTPDEHIQDVKAALERM